MSGPRGWVNPLPRAGLSLLLHWCQPANRYKGCLCDLGPNLMLSPFPVFLHLLARVERIDDVGDNVLENRESSVAYGDATMMARGHHLASEQYCGTDTINMTRPLSPLK